MSSVYHVLPKQVCHCPEHTHQFFGICRKPHAGVFFPDRLVLTWTIALWFIPRTILMVPLATRDRPIIDQNSKSVILPWYNTVYDPTLGDAIPVAPQLFNPARVNRLKPFLSEEWPVCLIKPHKYEWMKKAWAAEVYSKPYHLKEYVDWNGMLLDKFLFKWYRSNPLLDPVPMFGRMSHHQVTDYDQSFPEWRQTVKLLPCMVVTRCPIDDHYCAWSRDGIRRQELRCQMIFESRGAQRALGRGVSIVEQHQCLSFGRLIPEPACDDVGGWNINNKRVSDGQQKTLRVVHHAVAQLRRPNSFVVAAVYEDNAIFLFEIHHRRGFEKTMSASETKWDHELCFYGIKLGNFGANVPGSSGLGRVRGRVLNIAFDVREWMAPGFAWPKEEPMVNPCIRLRQPSALALVVLVDGEEKEEEMLPEEVLPAVTMSGGLAPVDPIAEELVEEETSRAGENLGGNCGTGGKSLVGGSKETPSGLLLPRTPTVTWRAVGPSGIALKEPKPITNTVSLDAQGEIVFPTSSKNGNPPATNRQSRKQSLSPSISPSSSLPSSKAPLSSNPISKGDKLVRPPNVHLSSHASKLRHPRKPRFLTHTIHLYQGHNKDIASGRIADPRGANWEYIGLPPEDSALIKIMRRLKKANVKLRAIRQGDWAEYNRLYVGNGIDESAWMDEVTLNRHSILSRGGVWPERSGFERCQGRANADGEGLGVLVRMAKSKSLRQENQEDMDKRIDRLYCGDLAVCSMGVAGDIGMGRVMGEEAVVPPGLGVGAYRPLKDPLGVPSRVEQGKGPLYNKSTFEFYRNRTTNELVAEASAVGKVKLGERALRERELATEDQIVGVLEDVDAPGVSQEELNGLKLVGFGATSLSDQGRWVQLAPNRVLDSEKCVAVFENDGKIASQLQEQQEYGETQGSRSAMKVDRKGKGKAVHIDVKGKGKALRLAEGNSQPGWKSTWEPW